MTATRIIEIGAPLGRGGSGEVWRAHHQALDRPVALKWLWRGEAQALRREARALAALDHPNVVAVHDLLWLPWAPGALAERPCLVMALAEGGDLAGVAGRLAWPTLAPLVAGALAGLAHVAARGHLHLDLKPANLLVAVHEGRARTCLSDFGLGRSQRAASEAEAAGGTPRFRPPEADAPGRLGPASDIFSLGVTLWALVTGRAPPLGGPLAPVAEGGGYGPGVATAPPGLDAFIARATQREPADRFANAAEARWALEALGGADLAAAVPASVLAQARAARSGGASVEVQPGVTAPAPSVAALSTQAVMSALPAQALPAQALPAQALQGVSAAHAGPTASSADAPAREVPAREVPVAAGLAPRPRLRVPAEAPAEVFASEPDVFAGAGLARARRPRIEGRLGERRALWAALHQVAETGRPAAVVLVGPAGAGASRLAAWLAEQARLTGAVAVAVLDGADLGRDEGEAGPARDRVLDARGALEVVAAALGHPAEGGDPRRLAAGLQARLADPAGPPLLVVLDPAEQAPSLVRWLRGLLDAARAPVLAVLTARPEALQTPALAALGAHPATARLDLAPLADAEVVALVRQRVALTSAVAEQVAARAAGLPGHAVALVAHAADRGHLVPTARGLAPVPGRRLRLPSDLAAAWRARARAVVGRDAAAGRLLAALTRLAGQADAPLRAALAAQGLRLTEAQVEALADRGLVRVADGALVLVQRALGEALWEEAVARGRARSLAERVAQAAASAWAPTGAAGGLTAATAGRLAGLWLAAGQPERAIAALLARSPDTFEALDAPETLALAEQLAGHLAQRGADPGAQAACRAVAARALFAAGRNLEAEARLESVDADAAAAAPLVARLELVQVAVLVALSQGRTQAAAARVSELVQLAAAVGGSGSGAAGVAVAMEARFSAARVEIVAGRYTAALALLGDLDAPEAARLPARQRLRARLLAVEAHMHRHAPGDLAAAETLCGAALATAERLGDPGLIMQATNNLGDIATREGDFEAAAAWFERAIEVCGDRFPLAAYPHANRAFVDLQRGAFEAARRRIDQALQRLAPAPPPRPHLLLAGLALHPLAALDLLGAWDARAAEVEALLAVTDVGFSEVQASAAAAAACLRATGDRARAERAEAIAAVMAVRAAAAG